MAYNDQRKQYSKIPFQYVEVEVDGVVTKFYDFNYGEVLTGFDGIPTLKSFTMSPAKIDINGGIGIRATGSVAIGEHEDYVTYGTLENPVRYWAAWTAKNRNYRYQRVSHFSGYLVDGQYSLDNFIKRDFVIETMAWGADGVRFSLRDPLMLANDDKAKLPLESGGILSEDIDNTVTSITLAPLGVGDLEYPAANFYVICDEEVIFCSSRTGDVLTVTRGDYGTLSDSHSFESKVQLCLFFENETPANIGYHLLTVGANVDPIYINKGIWDSRSADAFPNVYTMLITKPTGVKALLKEIGDSAPHYYFYDTRLNEIQFKPQEAPQNSGQILTYDANLLMGKTTVTDRKDLQITTVVIYYDIRNPVKDLKETSNYAKVYTREDTASVLANGGTRVYKTIFSRCIGTTDKSAAVLAASLTGRRFAVSPMQVNYELDPKDGEVWTGDAIRIESDLILNPTTLAPDLRTYQIITANEDTDSQRFKYTALEHTYGLPVEGDEDVENPNVRLVYISGENDQLKETAGGSARSLRDAYNDTYPDVQPEYDIRFIIEVGGVAGSSSSSAYAIRTGAWPELITPPIIINYYYILGRGGNGSYNTGEDGGPALLLENDIRLNNLGIIGGGGGGGGGRFVRESTGVELGQGGGGAGYFGGTGSANNLSGGSVTAEYLTGADGSILGGGKGGDLGVDGEADLFGKAGGVASHAIKLNGHVITYINTGTIAGAIIP